ncbi:MAG: endonuclease domain-containing protein [Clostridia bacterium]|nr:endonuclease domain-containing protein [Clostridia bacterium]
MNRTNNPKLKPFAQKLRRDMTKEERRLWYDFLKELPVNFNRQKVIGNYIADFYCASAKLIIEIDGTQHYEKEGKESDKIRDSYFFDLGMKVLRYSNYDVNSNFDGVCEDILRNLKEHSKSASP